VKAKSRKRRGKKSETPEILETERLLLRRAALEDAQAIFAEYAQDPEVTKHLTWRPHRRIETVYEFLRMAMESWENGRSFQWVILRKNDARLMGMIGFRVDGHKLEMGYASARAHWGKGYMTEAVIALIGWALKQEHIHRIWAVCDVENAASARVLEKAGMRREGILRRWSIHPGCSDEPRDSYCYAITK
jgi:RimJ/RimL family protein N-acetyltransferase